jgi:subtilisin-like proprotein convertase family protein
VVLMNRAGGAGDVFGANIKFDQQALTPIPDVGTIASGTYSPADYRGGAYDFPAPAPGGAYQTTLDAFNGGPASGTWSLYVYDAVLGDAGAITNGWSIAVTTQPVLVGLTNVYTLEDTPVTQPFTILDDSRTTPSFTFTKTSSKTDVIPVNNIVIAPVGTSGMDFTVTTTPAKFGSNAVITITAVNADGQSVQKSFTVDVGYKAVPPVVGALANTNMLAGTVLSIPVIYYDAHTPTNQLKVGVNSSNTGLVPAGNAKMIGTNLVIAPIGAATGVTTISVSVTNNDNLVTSVSFDLNVTENNRLFADSSAITINDAAKASPYPSSITVGGLASITDVNVTLAGFSHTFPQDVSILLIGPSGQGVVLMSRAGGSAPVSNVRLVFDDSAATALPSTGTFGDGSYRPADYKTVDFFQSPAPAGPYAKVLSAFNGLSPNGTWSLYVQDDAAQDAGAINQGWALTIIPSSGKAVTIASRGPSLSIGQSAEGLLLSVSGVPNVDYAIQSSSDLNNWSDVGTVTADDSGNAIYNVQSGQAPALFFRAVAR